jgi:hypothetical protein
MRLGASNCEATITTTTLPPPWSPSYSVAASISPTEQFKPHYGPVRRELYVVGHLRKAESANRKTSTNMRYQRNPKTTFMTWTKFITAQCAGGQWDQINEYRIKTFNGIESNQTHTYMDFTHPDIKWSPHIVAVIKSPVCDRRLCRTRIGERRNAHRILRGKHERLNLLGVLGISGRQSGRRSLSEYTGKKRKITCESNQNTSSAQPIA